MSSLDYTMRLPQFYDESRLVVQTVWSMKQSSFNREANTSSNFRPNQILWKMYFCSRYEGYTLKMKITWIWFLWLFIKWSQNKVKRVWLPLQRSKDWHALLLFRLSFRFLFIPNTQRMNWYLKSKRKFKEEVQRLHLLPNA